MGGLSMDQLMMAGLVGFGLFLGVMIFLTAGFYLFTAEETPVRDRLRMMKMQELAANGGNVSQGKEVKEAFLELVAPIAQNLYGQNKSFLDSIRLKLTEAGLPDNDDAVNRFLAIRVAVGLVGGAILFVLTLIISKHILITLFGMIIGMLVGAMLPQMNLSAIAKRRKAEIKFTLSDTLDLMVVCMEAGLGLDATMQRVADESERIAPEVAYEFKRLNKELNAGIPRTEAFHNLGSRAGVDELKALCALIIQTDKLGTSIADTLRIYAEDVRTKRKQRAELLASQASIKMTFPLVLLIFPPLFIVLIGPAVISTLNTFFNKPPM
jgi:tight adherence protein C